LRAGSERRAGGDPNASQASSPRRLARRTRARRTPGNTSRPRRCRPSRGRHVSPARGERPHSAQVRFSATVSDSCTREMIAHDVQSVPKRPRTEACNERAYRPSRQRFPCTSATSRHLAAIPARAADFTRNEGVPGSSPGVGFNLRAALRQRESPLFGGFRVCGQDLDRSARSWSKDARVRLRFRDHGDGAEAR
jgi:hypothetical protein